MTTPAQTQTAQNLNKYSKKVKFTFLKTFENGVTMAILQSRDRRGYPFPKPLRLIIPISISYKKNRPKNWQELLKK